MSLMGIKKVLNKHATYQIRSLSVSSNTLGGLVGVVLFVTFINLPLIDITV